VATLAARDKIGWGRWIERHAAHLGMQGDKLGHLLGYGVLMFWFCQLYAARRARMAYAVGFAALGVGLELAQHSLGYRTYEPFDMAANALGVALGWAAALASGGRLLARLEATLSRPRA